MMETVELPVVEFNTSRIEVTIQAKRVTGFTQEFVPDANPTVSIPTAWDFPEKVGDSPSVVIISSGLVQTLEDTDSHPFLRDLRQTLIEKGVIVLGYEDAGVSGSSDPAFKAYSLAQFSENLFTVAHTVTSQSWFDSRSKLVFFGFNSGCHSILNEVSDTFRSKGAIIYPHAIILVSPLRVLTTDIQKYLNREGKFHRNTASEVITYLYASPSKQRTVEIPGDFFGQSEINGSVQLYEALRLSGSIPLHIVRPKQDKFSGQYSLHGIARIVQEIVLPEANHDMTQG